MEDPRFRQGSRMNPKKVIILMTVAIFIVIGWLMVTIFEGWPPWPVLLMFTISHVFFCVVVARVKPYRGPYTKPMTDSNPDTWPL
jgi:hypothetical protein